MATTVIVDAHNALYRLLPSAPRTGDAQRRAVVRLAGEALRRHGVAGATAHLVFDTAKDGRHRAGGYGREGPVSWSYADGSADEAIVALVRDRMWDASGALLVVSDDRELRGRVTQLGARASRVQAWFHPPAEPAKGPAGRAGPPMSAADFGLSDGPIDLLRDDPDTI